MHTAACLKVQRCYYRTGKNRHSKMHRLLELKKGPRTFQSCADNLWCRTSQFVDAQRSCHEHLHVFACLNYPACKQFAQKRHKLSQYPTNHLLHVRQRCCTAKMCAWRLSCHVVQLSWQHHQVNSMKFTKSLQEITKPNISWMHLLSEANTSKKQI